LPQAILTSAQRSWVDRVLPHLSIAEHFAADRIITAEDVAHHSKATSRLPFQAAARALDLPYGSLIMVEDNSNNLKTAKELGMTTVLITHSHHVQPASHIDFYVPKAYDVFNLLPPRV
jgi:FMN phosphatase YigB (HAD superfamily)